MNRFTTRRRRPAGVSLRLARVLFAGVTLWSGVALASDCDIQTGNPDVDYGPVVRGNLPVTSAPVSLGKRQLTLRVQCREAQTFALRFDAEPASPSAFRFARGGYFTIDLKQASVDGTPALLAQTTGDRQITSAGVESVYLIPHSSVIVVGRNGRVSGKSLMVQLEIETFVVDATTRVRDITALIGAGTLRVSPF